MPWFQQAIELPAKPRGFHLVTPDILAKLPQLGGVRVGLLHLFLQHTSASLSINENADADVPRDLETSFSAIAPEDFPYRHTCEGPDDMPAHVKASLLGASLSIPIREGTFGPGDLAGDLSLRTPQSRRAAAIGRDDLGRVSGGVGSLCHGSQPLKSAIASCETARRSRLEAAVDVQSVQLRDLSVSQGLAHRRIAHAGDRAGPGPPMSLGAMKAWTSSIAPASSRVPRTSAPPSTRMFVIRRRPSSSSKCRASDRWSDAAAAVLAKLRRRLRGAHGNAHSGAFAAAATKHRRVGRRADELAVEREDRLRIEHDPRRRPRAGGARREQRVVLLRRAAADDDRIDPPAQLVNDGARLLAADPLAVAGVSRELAVERHRPLGDHPRAAAVISFANGASNAAASSCVHRERRRRSPPPAVPSTPRPSTSGFGSRQATTTRATPAAISASVQGGVLPA